MPRRETKIKVIKENRQEGIAKGKTTKLYYGFPCLNFKCDQYIFIENKELTEEFSIICPNCSYEHSYDGSTKFFDYKLKDFTSNKQGKLIEEGDFLIYHIEHIKKSSKYKYCGYCNSLQQVKNFSSKSSNASGYQEYCKNCKDIYNSIKNQTRTTDQHRESAQKRRLYIDLVKDKNIIDSNTVYKRFNYKCFNCNEDLSAPESKKHLDHTLPAYYFWPLTTENATLLCSTCNGKKSNIWPNEFYKDEKILKELSILTGIKYDILKNKPIYNPSALKELKKKETIDNLLTKYAKYIDEIIKVRNRILKDTAFDFFSNATNISDVWRNQANDLL